ncbi:MAG: hypothetical protein JAY74_14185 [Candidatus Thiodiazotropha taylori]|nr:hypothetical protein [Candidatus Thiodiazotropha taylori]
MAIRNSRNIRYAVIGEFNEEAIEYIEAQIGEKLEPHDSLYKGDYWLHRRNDPELNIELRINVDPMHDSASDPEDEYYFDYKNKDCALLLDIDGDPMLVEEISSRISCNPKFRLVLKEDYTW